MFKIISRSLRIIPKAYRGRILALQVMLVIAALAEFFSVLAIAPFIALAVNPQYVHTNAQLKDVYQWLGVANEHTFIMLVGCTFVFLFFIANVFLLKVQTLLVKLASVLEASFSVKLFNYYLAYNLAHVSVSNSLLISNINDVVKKLCSGVILPLLQINARLFSIAVLLGLLIVLSGFMAFMVGAMLAGCYLAVFFYSSSAMKRNGSLSSQLNRDKAVLLRDGLDGRKYIELYGLQEKYKYDLAAVYKQQVEVSVNNKLLKDLPYYTIETLAFLIIVVVVSLTLSPSIPLELALGELGVICLAGYRLIPKFQQVYRAATQFKTSQSALDRISTELLAAEAFEKKRPVDRDPTSLAAYGELVVENICFGYEPNRQVLSDINFMIKPGQVLGLIGPSGVGKSTLVQILLGLLQPMSGKISYGGVEVTKAKSAEWRSHIGFVDATTYIFDGTVKANVLLGAELDEIWLEDVMRISSLTDVIQDLPDGLDTDMGNKGLRLSSGQLQRLGFARALYRRPKILVLDEATNALDSELQYKILVDIRKKFPELMVIVVSHRPDIHSIFDKKIELTRS